MKSKDARILVFGILSLATALAIWQWSGSNIAIQVGGSQNKIEQKMDARFESPSRK
jgi:hypothetical protein